MASNKSSPPGLDLGTDVVTLTAALCDIESVSGSEGRIADAIETALEPKGVLVVVDAEHLCMSMRGVKKSGTSTVTSAVRGLFRSDTATRFEAMQFVQGR